jgi:hypothetical protein
MIDDDLPVLTQLNVQLGAVRAARHGITEGGQRVFRAQARAAAMGDVQWSGQTILAR